MRSGKHILVVTPGFPANEADDSCIPPLQVFLAECRARHPELTFSVIAFHYPFTSEPYSWKGIRVYPCDGRNRKWPGRLLTWRKAKQLFNAIHRERPVDLIHSFWLGECAFVGERFAKRHQLPHVATLMGQDVLPSNRYLHSSLLQHVPLVALCERHAATFEKHAGRKATEIIPWGIEGEPAASLPRTFDIFAAGSLIPLKRYYMLVMMTLALKRDFPGLRVLLAGDGPELPKLQEMARGLGLKENILFAGQLSREEVQHCMRSARLFVHPSEYESYGYVFAEALKNGMHVLSFPVGAAQASERWEVVRSEAELIAAAKRILSAQAELPGVILHSAAETVERYAALYETLRTYRDRRS